jgi:oligopeptide/dipeptide ABC transporter ATP-binding protein
MGDPLLEVEDLTIQYETAEGPLTAVSDVSFTVDRGEYFGLVGESGCGKSTIVKSLIGGLDPNGSITGGTITYDGEEIQDFTEKQFNEKLRWKEVALIPQGSMNNLDPIQRIGDQAVEIARTHTDLGKQEALERFGDTFKTVGLQRSRIDDYPHEFSGGMQQRAIIALALFLDPSIILADEPTTALDVIMQDQIFKFMDTLKADLDMSMLLITHDISLIFESCDNMGVMHGGTLAERGSVYDLYDRPRHPYSILLQEAFPDIDNPDRELGIIEGTPPRNIGEVTECSFADRCPWAVEGCRDDAPEIAPVDGDETHQAACIRKDEVFGLYEGEVGDETESITEEH